MFEHHNEPLISRRAFVFRMARFGLVALGLIAGSLFLGVLGYHLFEGLSWLDALVNASMLLGGMGPVDPLHTVGGKLFASFYALYAGMIFLVIVGLIFAPIFHRFMHHFHLEIEGEDDADATARQAKKPKTR